MTDQIYFYTEIHFIKYEDRGFLRRNVETLKFFPHLVLATDRRDARIKAEDYGRKLLAPSDLIKTKFVAVMVYDTIR